MFSEEELKSAADICSVSAHAFPAIGRARQVKALAAAVLREAVREAEKQAEIGRLFVGHDKTMADMESRCPKGDWNHDSTRERFYFIDNLRDALGFGD